MLSRDPPSVDAHVTRERCDSPGLLLRRFLRFLLPAILLLCLPLGASAQQAPPDDPGTKRPGTVEVGVWLNGIHDMDFMRGSFNASFYVWWISRDPQFEPFESLQVLNGWEWSARGVNRQVLPDGRHYVAGFLNTTVSHATTHLTGKGCRS